jgi:hypothetical protein
VGRTWEYLDRSQTHDVNVEIGTEAAQFLSWDYINPNFLAMWDGQEEMWMRGRRAFLKPRLGDIL